MAKYEEWAGWELYGGYTTSGVVGFSVFGVDDEDLGRWAGHRVWAIWVNDTEQEVYGERRFRAICVVHPEWGFQEFWGSEIKFAG